MVVDQPVRWIVTHLASLIGSENSLLKESQSPKRSFAARSTKQCNSKKNVSLQNKQRFAGQVLRQLTFMIVLHHRSGEPDDGNCDVVA